MNYPQKQYPNTKPEIGTFLKKGMQTVLHEQDRRNNYLKCAMFDKHKRMEGI